MEYQEALGRWAAIKAQADPDSWADFEVDIEMDPGYACCGGTDPLCYCSLAESPSCKLVVYSGKQRVWSSSYFDFTSVVREILEVAS